MGSVKLVLASRNPHKLRELRQLLDPHEVLPLPDGVVLPPEDGETFAENALAKARAGAAATGRETIGEDSGIEARVLEGAPGIRSARYAGERATDGENLDKLLSDVEGKDDRAAAYVCALAFASPDGSQRLFEGRCEGRLVEAPRGEGGFGYDPIFEPDDDDSGLTMAELPAARKNALSHRGRAARLLRESLRERG